MSIWHRYGMRLVELLISMLLRMLPRHEPGIIAKIEPTRDAPGVRISGFKGAEWITPLHVYAHDIVTATYHIRYDYRDGNVVEMDLVGTFGFDQEAVRNSVCRTGYSYYDNALTEATLRPMYPEEEYPIVYLLEDSYE